MKNLKKVLLFVFAAATVLLCFISFASALNITEKTDKAEIVAVGKCGLLVDNLAWELDTSGTLTIYGEGDMENYTWTNFVPTTPWYQYKDNIYKVVISDGVTSIGSSAFYKLINVTSFEIPDTVVVLGSYSFSRCYGITEVELPEKLQYIYNYCFEDCNKLINISIPDSVSRLGDCSFSGCTDLKDIDLPSNITSLPRGVFSECESLESIIIPDNITELVSYCFRDCVKLKDVVFPVALKSIGNGVFSGCQNLEKINIPDTVTALGSEIFLNCTNLQQLKLPDTLEEIPTGLCNGCSGLTEIELPSSITKIGSSAFSNCTNLTGVALNDGLKIIEQSAFFKCINLKSIIIPGSVTSIGKNAYGLYLNSLNQTSVVPEAKVLCFSDTTGEAYAKESNLPYSILSLDLRDSEYTGREILPDIIISIDGKTLNSPGDYVVIYENNIEIGTATAKISFSGDYFAYRGVCVKNFRIGESLDDCAVKLDKSDYQYGAYVPEITLSTDDLCLKINKDYEVYYSLSGNTWKKDGDNITTALWDVGVCSIRVIGINRYIGEKILTVPVSKFDLKNARIVVDGNSFDLQNFEYDGTEKKQKNIVVRDSKYNIISVENYSVSYKNNTDVGIATMIITGKGKFYTGAIEKNFEIYPRAVSSIKVSQKPDKTIYHKNEKKIDVTGGKITVYYQNGGKDIINIDASMLDNDYNLSMDGLQNIWLTYMNCSTYFEIKVQEHKYTDKTTKATLSKNGKIETKCTVCGDISNTKTFYYPKTIKLSATTFTYNGKTKTPSVTVKDSNGKILKKGTDYTVTYPKKRKSIGKYTVTVTFKGNYSGTKKLTFEIVPAKVSLSKVSAEKKQLTATWKTVSGATGYEVVYSTSKKFTKKTTKTVTIKKAKTKKTTIKKLKKGKKYYVKVRAYKTVNGKKIYGAFSSVKNAKVK